jgi:CYTH domain-containing protein/predicted ATPase
MLRYEVVKRRFFTMQHIPKIVITGGPCSGKTTALSAIVQFCQDHGFYPVVIPEVATDLILSGFDRTALSFQDFVTEKLLFEEAIRLRAVECGHLPQNTVIIYDRGLCDSEAYVGREAFLEVLQRQDLSLVEARDHYSGIICLDSAAVGAEEFYTTSNNAARNEGLEEARALNERTKDAWMGSPHFKPIPNREGADFDGKITECLKALAGILGVPEPIENERKFLVEGFCLDQLPEHSVPITIVQTYLIGIDCGVERVRKRGQDGHHLYFHTVKIPHEGGGSVEVERFIDKQTYDELLLRKDPTRNPIVKTRYCFRHADHYCELDVFGGRVGLVMLEVEVHDMSDHVELPLYLGTFQEVTGNQFFSNHELSRH